jgi:hypothetical protein
VVYNKRSKDMEAVTVHFTIDWQGLAKTLGVKALQSRKGRATSNGGAVVARAKYADKKVDNGNGKAH